jgi:mRNA interferase MazF
MGRDGRRRARTGSLKRPPDPPAIVRRGEVWWVDLDPTRGSEIRKIRPAVVLSANALNRVRRTVIVVPLSTGPLPHPPIVIGVPSAGSSSVAICDQIRAVDKTRLTERAGELRTEDVRSVENGVRAVLEL